MESSESSGAIGKRPEGDASLAHVWDQFYRYCFTIINQCPGVRKLSTSDREDCVQDVMMEIVRKFGVYQPTSSPDNLTGWIRVLSRNKAADILRRRFRKPEVLFDDGAGGRPRRQPRRRRAGAARGECVSLVWEALISLDQKVSATSYLVFYLRTIEGWDIPEISELFQISLGPGAAPAATGSRRSSARSSRRKERRVAAGVPEGKPHGASSRTRRIRPGYETPASCRVIVLLGHGNYPLPVELKQLVNNAQRRAKKV